jgi:hypothetical protein
MATETPGMAVAHYCVGCGKGLIASAAMCPGCGTPVRASTTSKGKDKTVAVLLAVFLSGWTWLYTYRVNAAKFWIYIAVSFFSTLVGIGVILASEFVAGFGAFAWVPGGLVTVYLVGFGFWLWAVIDSATKPRDWYEDYV